MSGGAAIHPTSTVSPQASLGADVSIGPYVLVHDNVVIGDGSHVASHVVLGAPTSAYYRGRAPYRAPACRIGERAVIRSHCVIYGDVVIGTDFETGHHVTVREGAIIGDGVRIGTLCDLQPGAQIGNYVRLHSNVFVARGTRIEDLAWVFPHALLIDDPHPPSDTCTDGPTIRRAAVVGAQSIIYPAVEIGERAVVGAMSLVRSDVPPDSVAVGTPARIVGAAADVVCHEGRLDRVYPWWSHFRRGYPEGVLPDADAPS